MFSFFFHCLTIMFPNLALKLKFSSLIAPQMISHLMGIQSSVLMGQELSQVTGVVHAVRFPSFVVKASDTVVPMALALDYCQQFRSHGGVCNCRKSGRPEGSQNVFTGAVPLY